MDSTPFPSTHVACHPAPMRAHGTAQHRGFYSGRGTASLPTWTRAVWGRHGRLNSRAELLLEDPRSPPPSTSPGDGGHSSSTPSRRTLDVKPPTPPRQDRTGPGFRYRLSIRSAILPSISRGSPAAHP
ncbi:hypothetical protein CSHISOI_00398 [Colletotrichum shisoi]|uniref:Uncharacterized protein n=1 Tax=Colletotrichum shisoi TaxID=2078593 RepID=A0A5Q4C6S4_9PEZI|nr:hypothetical protein CSHISOI_00398 [Colletotrichum shisoi]